MTDDIALGPGREFDAIRAMVERWGPRAQGIGDDAAVLAVPRGDALVASVDTSIEGRHFRREWLSPREIGYRAVAAALSDLAAMAARPLGILVALGVPESWRESLSEIADGIGEAAAMARAPIVGGNMSDAGELSITTTVLGSAYAPLTRASARPGDRIYVTGRLGGPATALAGLLAGRTPSPDARARFAHPVPRLDEARWLADRGASTAIDVSDGLAGDLAHLAASSHVSLVVDLERVPCMSGVDAHTALGSGEEYELVVTAPAEIDAAAFDHRFGIPFTEIGVVIAGVAEVVLREAGARVANPRGHDHFS